MLRSQALALEAKNRHFYLRVIGIDATKPTNFRVVTKKAAKPKKISVARKPIEELSAPSKRALEVKKADTRAIMGAATSVGKPREKTSVTAAFKGGRKFNAAKKSTKAS